MTEHDALFARARDDIHADQWHFQWQAPPAGTGAVALYLAGVDGDGAGSVEEIATDPLGDDVMTAELSFFEAGHPPPAGDTASGCEGARSAAPWGLGLLLLGLWGVRRTATARAGRRPTPECAV